MRDKHFGYVGTLTSMVDEMIGDGLEESAFEAIYREHFRPLLRLVFLVTGQVELAEEIVQDAFGKLIATKRDVRDPGAWLRTVALRDAVRVVRRSRRVSRPAPDIAPSPTRDLDLWDALKALPPRQRAVIVLHYYEDRPVCDIARHLRLKESTVRVHLHKAVARLRSILGETEEYT